MPAFGPRRLSEGRRAFLAWGALLCAVLALLASGCGQSPEAKKKTALERAERYLGEGKPNEAIIELRTALQVDKDFVPALHALGRAYAAKLWYADAARELGRAHSLSPDSVSIAADLGRALVELGAWHEADDLAQRILAREPQSGVGLYIRTSALLGQGRAEEALALVESASKGGGVAPEVEALRGQALFRLGQLEAAEQAYRSALAHDPGDARSLAGLGEIKLARKDYEGAAKAFTEARALRPGDPRIRLGLASARFQLNQLPEAIRELEGVEPRARTVGIVMALGFYYLRANRPADAIQLVSTVVERLPNATQARFLLGTAFLANNQPDLAASQFEAVDREKPGDPMVQFRLAQAYLRRGRARDALARLDAVAKPFEKVPDYHLERARTLLLLGRVDAAAAAVASVQRLAPNAPQAYLLLGQIRMSQGNAAGAREMYVKAAELDATYVPAHLALGQLAATERDMQGALREFDAAVQADPKSVMAVRAKVAALVAEKRLKEALDFVESRLKEDPGNVALHALLGTLYAGDGQLDKAQAEYRKARDLDPRAVEPRLGLARVALKQDREREAIEQLQAVIKDHPDHATAVLLLASVQDKLGQYSQAIAVLEGAQKEGFQQQPMFPILLGDLYAKTGRYDDAIKLMDGVLAQSPGLASARLLRGRAYLAKRDATTALKEFTEVARANPKSAAAQYLLARTYLALGRTAEAQTAYGEALRLDPNLEAAKRELAALKGEKPDAASQARRVGELQAAVRKDPNNVSLRAGLARALLVNGQVKEAQAELKQVLDTAPTHTEANFMMAQVLLRSGNADEAAGYLRAALRGNPSHLEANVLLASYLESKGRVEEAIGYFERALRVNPSLVDVKLALGGLYARTGRLPQALKLAEEVEKTAPGSAVPLVLKGGVLLAQQNPKGAAEAYGAALKLRPDLIEARLGLAQALDATGEIDRAADAYRAVLAAKPDNIVALNNLAWLLAERRKRPDEALPLASRAQQLAPQSAAVLDTLGWVQYRRGAYADAEKALAGAVERSPDTAAFQYHLGMTLYRLGRKSDAVTALRRVGTLDAKLAEREKLADLIREIGGS